MGTSPKSFLHNKLSSLGSKFILLVVFILSITMGVATYINYYLQLDNYTEQLKTKGEMLGSFVSLISEDAILGYDYVLLDHYMKEISAQKDVVYGFITSPDNNNLSSYLNKRNPYIQSALYKGNSKLIDIVKDVNIQNDILPLSFSINNDDELIGFVHIGLSIKRADALSIQFLKGQIIEIIIILLFLIACIYYVFRTKALHPIHNLMNSFERFAMGDVDHKANASSNDELGSLAHSFNLMTDALNRTHNEKDKVVQQLLEANKNLEASTRAKSSFLANMSHEIRTPLTAIIGFGDYLKEPDISKSDKEKAIDSIIQNGVHLQHIINDILDLSKVEAEKLEIEPLEISPFELLDDIESLINIQIRERGLAYNIDYNFPLPGKITTDPVRLKQILINLCNNAIKFTEKGRIAIKVYYKAEQNILYFSVTDTGIGLSSEQQERIFESFVQADTSIARKYGGTGLGLALSGKLAEKLGGTITLESELGKGSNFTVSINPGPVESAELVMEAPATDNHGLNEPVVTSPATFTGNILLAEDNIDNQRLISMYIHKTGATVHVVENGKQAVDAAMQKEYDLILMDMQMPVMDGIEAVSTLREQGYTKPIAALTANAMKSDRKTCFQAGCNDFLVKPINRKEFTNLLARYLTGITLDSNTPIYSTMQNETPEFMDIIDMFLGRLPELMQDINQAFEKEQWEILRKLAHDLKGTSGSLGFPQLMEISAGIEKQLINNTLQNLTDNMNKLCSTSNRIIAGHQNHGSSELKTNLSS